MFRILQYYSRFQQAKGSFGVFPAWGRWLLIVLAVPGLVLAALSIVLLGISILALLVMTAPAYRLLRMCGGGAGSSGEAMVEATVISRGPVNPSRVPIEVKILES